MERARRAKTRTKPKKEKTILLMDRLGCSRVDWMDSNLRSGLCLCQSHGRGDLRDDAISKT